MSPATIREIQLSLIYFTPELMLTATFMLVLIAEILIRRTNYVSLGVLTIIGLLASSFLAIKLYGFPETLIFFRMMAVDSFSIFFKLLFALSGILVVLFSWDSEELRRYSPGEYYCLILAVILGMNLMAASTNLLMIWLALEMVSVPSYLLSGFLKDSKLSAEASLKFVIYGAVSTAVMLFGFSYLFGMTGSYDLSGIQQALASSHINSAVLLITVSLILVGVGYKIAAVPFHFWCPDVYQGSPTVITAFFSIGPKAAGFALLIRLFYGAFASGGPDYQVVGSFHWPTLIALISGITMTVGNVVAIWQTSMKRMLAYSSIAHVGYMLMGFVLLNGEGIRAILFYLLVYLVMNLGAFLVVVALSNRMDSDELPEYRGLIYRAPTAATILGLFLLSLTGIPLLGGFIGKLYLFLAVVHAGYYWLVVLAALNTVISFVYYGGVIKRMFLEEGKTKEPIRIPRLSSALLTVLAIAILLLGTYWAPFADFSQSSVAMTSRTYSLARK